MKGLIAVPHTGYFPYQTMAAWAPLLMNARVVSEVDYQLIGSSLIYDAREMAAEHMLKNGHDWLLFLDSDMVPPADMIPRLLAHDKPIVSGIAFKRIPPYSPCFYPKLEYDGKEVKLLPAEDWTQGLGEVEGVGMACTLIRREVFEKTPKPWFFPMPVLAEDLGFCLRAREAGFKIYVDTTLVCGHVATEVITDAHYRAYREAAEKNG